MADHNRVFYNANDDTYGYIREAEKDANDELTKIKKVLGEDFELKQYYIDNICKKALGLSYDHSYEELVNKQIRHYRELAKEKAIRYIKTNKQEDYDKAKELLETYEELKKYELIPVDNLWNVVDDNIYEVEIDSNGRKYYTEFDPNTILNK